MSNPETLNPAELNNQQLVGALRLLIEWLARMITGTLETTTFTLLREACNRLETLDTVAADVHVAKTNSKDLIESLYSEISDLENELAQLRKALPPAKQPSERAWLIIFIEKVSGRLASWGVYGESCPTTYAAYHPTVLCEFKRSSYALAAETARASVTDSEGDYHWLANFPSRVYMGAPLDDSHCTLCGGITTRPGPGSTHLCAHCDHTRTDLSGDLHAEPEETDDIPF